MLVLLIELTLGVLVVAVCWVALELRRVQLALREDTASLEAWEVHLAELNALAHPRPEET